MGRSGDNNILCAVLMRRYAPLCQMSDNRLIWFWLPRLWRELRRRKFSWKSFLTLHNCVLLKPQLFLEGSAPLKLQWRQTLPMCEKCETSTKYDETPAMNPPTMTTLQPTQTWPNDVSRYCTSVMRPTGSKGAHARALKSIKNRIPVLGIAPVSRFLHHWV